MSHDVTTALEAEYEPAHDETDERVVIGSTCSSKTSHEPLCVGTDDDTEMQF